MERRLTSCVAYALRVSYKMEVPSVTEHLKSALHCVRTGFCTHVHPDEAVAQRQIVRLYDALHDCKTQHFADASIQTEANMCTEMECKAVAEGVLKTAQAQFEKLLVQTEMIIQDRDATIHRMEIDLDSRISQMQALVHGMKVSTDVCLPEVGTTARASSVATSRPLHESLLDLPEGNHQFLIDQHRKHRMEMKQRRKAERLQRLQEYGDG